MTRITEPVRRLYERTNADIRAVIRDARFRAIATATAAGMLLLSAAVHSGMLTAVDRSIITAIQRAIPVGADTFASLFSLAGSFELTTLALIVLVFLTYRRWYAVLVSLAYFALGLGIEIIGKSWVRQPSPPEEFARYSLGFLFPTSKYQTGFSYPSGHSLRSSFLTVLVIAALVKSRHISRPVKTAGCIVVCLLQLTMLTTRISLGEHWPMDVVAGALLGFGSAAMALVHLGMDARRRPRAHR